MSNTDNDRGSQPALPIRVHRNRNRKLRQLRCDLCRILGSNDHNWRAAGFDRCCYNALDERFALKEDELLRFSEASRTSSSKNDCGHSHQSLRGLSACSLCDCMRVTPAFTQKTARPIGQHRRHLGDDCQRDFFRRFAADVQSGRREQVSNTGFKIERSILAESCQQFRMTFSRPQQSDISKLQGEKPIECEKITAEVMIHYKRCGLRIRSKMLVECGRMREMLDDPSEISTYLSERFDLGSGTEK